MPSACPAMATSTPSKISALFVHSPMLQSAAVPASARTLPPLSLKEAADRPYDSDAASPPFTVILPLLISSSEHHVPRLYVPASDFAITALS